jgi:phage terminase small subunit
VKFNFSGESAMTTHKPPAHLSPIAKAEWRRIVELREDRGLFDELRLASIEGYAINYSRFVEAEKLLTKAIDPVAIDRLLSITGTAQRKLREHARDLGLPIQVQPRAPRTKDATDWAAVRAGLDAEFESMSVQ